jgi:hypothetical protein
MNSNNQLTLASGYNSKNIIFQAPIDSQVPNSKPVIKFKRVPIKVKNSDGTVGDLILSTEDCFSFGVSENRSLETKALTGYNLAISLWGKEGPTPEQKEWIDAFNSIVDSCKKHLVATRKELGKHDLEMSDLKKFNPAYFKRDEQGNVVKDKGPVLYVKLLSSKKDDGFKILSNFYDVDDNPIPALDLLDKRCNVKAAIKIESIFVGSKISLQLKLYEATVQLLDVNNSRRLLPRPTGDQVVRMSKQSNPLLEDDNGSIGDDDIVLPKKQQSPPPSPKNEDEPKKSKRKVKNVVVE